MASTNGDNTVHFEATSRRRRKRRTSMTVNLTPAIDITFLLLIFFVVSTRFASQEGSLETRLPRDQGVLNVTPLPVSPIRVLVAHAPNGYRLSIQNWRNQPASFVELTQVLESIQGRPGFDSETPVIIMADDEVSWDEVTNCYNAVRRAGADDHTSDAVPFRHISFGSRRGSG